MKPGDMVGNLDEMSRSTLFSCPFSSTEPRIYVGLLTGIGIILEVLGNWGGDVRILNSEGVAGWTIAGNLRCLNEIR